MNSDAERLEHLFSRCLDGESTPQEAQLLARLPRSDPQVRAEYAAYEELDQLVGAALRGVPAAGLRRHDGWRRVGKAVSVAVAACLATLAWLRPTQPPAHPGATGPQQAGVASWFMPRPPAADVVEPLSPALERPQIRLRGTERDWLVIPNDAPNSYLIIEVNRVRTHAIGVHRDF